ncbi:tail-specific protease [bacterium BRH_c32]|nr:MAG: tail-specific protease [bacterium BRH_c32]
MKKLLFVVTMFVFVTGCNAQTPESVLDKDHKIDTNKVIVPDEFLIRKNQLLTNLLSNYHYRKSTLNDSLSVLIFDDYLKSMDSQKLYFYKSDIEGFQKYKLMLDDYLKMGNLNPAYEIFNVYKKRLGERVKYVKELLKTEFDFTKDESFTLDREKATWMENEKEMNEEWRLRIKNEALNLKLSGKDWKGTVDVLGKRYDNYYKLILQYEAEDVFQLYMNSFAEVYDPHSNYLSPSSSDAFNISMKLSLEGIGATLRFENDYTTVVSIVPGGPAAKSGLIKEEDRIVAVAQGDEGEFVDVVGWRLDDTIQLIRGKKGTVVRLSILKKEDGINAIPKEIRLVRDKVKLEEQAAKDEIINIEENGKPFKLGVIKLPSFYSDFEAARNGDPDYKSTTKDVKKILGKFKNEKVDGVILDLRNNGGGSLQEAISLTGLFIKDGPVVQVKNSNGEVEVDKDPDPTIIYDGPLAVMINRFSASASEIFSAAIQDYGRGLIVGENSYGKGTVQNLIDLSRFLSSKDKSGELKITIAKFYRINGSSTQNLGVEPDIELPSLYDKHEYGESSKPSALPWDKIQSSEYQKYGNLNKYIPELDKKHKIRIEKDPQYLYVKQDIAEYKETKAMKTFSLNEEVRKADKEKAEKRKKEREDAKKNNLKLLKKDEVEVKSELLDDFDLKETGNILADFIMSKVG